VSGWPIEQIASDALLNFWMEIQKRKIADINAHNYAAAFLVSCHQTEPGKKLDHTIWLPYQIMETSEEDNKPRIADRAVTLLEANRDRIPHKMLIDLYRNDIIKPLEQGK
jgi:hypothetical protein